MTTTNKKAREALAQCILQQTANGPVDAAVTEYVLDNSVQTPYLLGEFLQEQLGITEDEAHQAIARIQAIDTDDINSLEASQIAAAGPPGYETQPPKFQQQPQYDPSHCEQTVHSSLIQSAAETLLSNNTDLSHDAALAASTMTYGNIELAQYLIDVVQVQTPICRYFLTNSCFRADCNFSHDVTSHTCLFWLKSKCAKGPACRYQHGFGASHLNGLQVAPPPSSYARPHYTVPPPATTQQTPAPNSFANVAARGYQDHSNDFPSLKKQPTEKQQNANNHNKKQSKARLPTVPIPPDLWNHKVSRDASAFYIRDPIERYQSVVKRIQCPDHVMDLHFQSVTTFPTVLEHYLGDKLHKHGQVWVITGTGHSVSTHRTHQKSGGALEQAVLDYLLEHEYNISRGKDASGMSGAILVKR